MFIKITSGLFKNFYLTDWPGEAGALTEAYTRSKKQIDPVIAEKAKPVLDNRGVTYEEQ